MDKGLENAGIDYFSQLYGATSDQGDPQQTMIDKLRDRLIAKAYRTHSSVQISESDVLDVGCGYGWLLDAFEGARSLSGVDIAHHAIEQAKLGIWLAETLHNNTERTITNQEQTRNTAHRTRLTEKQVQDDK